MSWPDIVEPLTCSLLVLYIWPHLQFRLSVSPIAVHVEEREMLLGGYTHIKESGGGGGTMFGDVHISAASCPKVIWRTLWPVRCGRKKKNFYFYEWVGCGGCCVELANVQQPAAAHLSSHPPASLSRRRRRYSLLPLILFVYFFVVFYFSFSSPSVRSLSSSANVCLLIECAQPGQCALNFHSNGSQCWCDVSIIRETRVISKTWQVERT